MKHRLVLSLIVLALLGLTTACTKMENTPEAALSVARLFMDARANRNAGALYSLLTDAAREAMDRTAVNNYVAGQRVTYGSLGAIIQHDDGWAQVAVHDLSIASEGRTVRWPEALLTLRYEDEQWRVAWAEPLIAQAAAAYHRGDYMVELDLGRTVADVDPYHYRGPLEQHYAYRGMDRPREAERLLLRAAQLATPIQQPDVQDATARFKLSRGLEGDAIEHARTALNLAAAYIPATYPVAWQVDTMVVQARAHLAIGDRQAAEELVRTASELDPGNSSVLMLQQTLRQGPTPGSV